MLNKEILAKIKHIQIRARHLVTENLSGEYHSAFRGQGIEFDELREYMPGDDIRSIDWKVTARMNAPFVKVFREEREQTLMLMIDVSASQDYTSHYRLKREMAAELAAVLAFLATKNNDKVGLICFSDHVEEYVPPKKGRGHIWNIIRTILTYESKSHGTELNSALEFMASVVKKKSTCFVISDYIAENYLQSMTRLARRHELVAVRIMDPAETQAPSVGLVEIEDCETGERTFVNLSSRYSKQILQEVQGRYQGESAEYFRKHGIDYFDIVTDESTIEPLTKFIRRKERR